MFAFQSNGLPGPSRVNSLSSSMAEVKAFSSRAYELNSLTNVSVEDVVRDAHLPRNDFRKQRKQRRKRHCPREADNLYLDNNAIQPIENDTENIFAFNPPTAAECRIIEQLRYARTVVSENPNGDNHFDAHRFHDHDLRTLLDRPVNSPNATFCGLSICHDAFSDSFHQSSTLAHDSSGIHQTFSEDYKSSRRKASKNRKTEQTDLLGDDKNENGEDIRSLSVASFEFETSSLDEESLKQRQWSSNNLDDSPYPEVRASVSNVDDTDMPILTIRMWLVGLTLCCISTGVNTFFYFRFPAPSIVPLVLILISYPIGNFLAYILPIITFRLPSWFSRWCKVKEFSLNPGPWNIKEHACVYLMANVSIAPAYSLNTIVVAERFYKIKLGIGFNLTLVLATQLIGLGLAGLVRRFLVWPASMIWPSNLVVCTLLNTLHAEEDAYSPTISRYKFFTFAVLAAFFYYFLPGFLFQALSLFSYVCWIAPKNIVLNQLFGVRSGLGMGILTFDWSMISFIGSPLMIPWWAQVHTFAGFVLFFWILAPILYYTNFWNLSRFPMASNVPFDVAGQPYNITRVVTPEHTLDVNAYASYGPLYLPATYVIAYVITLVLSTCVLTHTVLYHGKSVLDNIRNKDGGEDDVHAQLMRRYPEVPDWWYVTCFLTFFSMGIVSVQAWQTGMPVWALTLTLVLSVIYLLPCGFIYATTGQTVTLNFVGEIIPGVLFPGKPLVNMIFKAYSVQTVTGALSFAQNLKLGHYVKISPRANFSVQVISAILASFVQVSVKEWVFHNIADLCSPLQKDLLTCPHNEVYYTASVIWGLIGPGRQLGKMSIYRHEVYALIIGLLAPIPLWYWSRRHPDARLPHINLPVILNGPTRIPPATGINYSSWFAVGFIFQYIIRTRRFAWWSKFNYVLSAALDSGTVLSVCAVFFFLQLPRGGFFLNWVGNTIFTKTADWNSTSLIPPLPPS